MKKVFIFSLLLIFVSAVYAQTANTFLILSEIKHDFGNINEKDGKVAYKFTFKNTGTNPLLIENISTGCGCTTINYSKAPINPGKTGQITVIYNPAYRPGVFSKEIDIITNHQQNINRIWIKGNVIPFTHPVQEDYPYDFSNGLYLSLQTLAFGKASRQIALRYANTTNQSITLSFESEGIHPELTFTNPGKLSAGQRGEITLQYNNKGNSGPLLFNLYVVRNGVKLKEKIQISVAGGK
jgi:hypothetical protein